MEFPSLAGCLVVDRDLPQYLKRISKIQALRASPFFTYFFSYANLQGFYDKKALEYKRDWLADLAATGPETAKQSQTSYKSIMSLMQDFNNEDKAKENVLQIFLDETATKNERQVELVKSATAISEEILGVLSVLKEKVAGLGKVMGELGGSWTELEDSRFFGELKGVEKTQLSQIYSEIKFGAYSWSNSLERLHSQFKKQVVASSSAVAALYDELHKNLNVRREAVLQVCYSSRFQPQATDLLNRREEKLRAINEHVFAELLKSKLSESYHLEKMTSTLKSALASDDTQPQIVADKPLAN